MSTSTPPRTRRMTSVTFSDAGDNTPQPSAYTMPEAPASSISGATSITSTATTTSATASRLIKRIKDDLTWGMSDTSSNHDSPMKDELAISTGRRLRHRVSGSLTTTAAPTPAAPTSTGPKKLPDPLAAPRDRSTPTPTPGNFRPSARATSTATNRTTTPKPSTSNSSSLTSSFSPQKGNRHHRRQHNLPPPPKFTLQEHDSCNLIHTCPLIPPPSQPNQAPHVEEITRDTATRNHRARHTIAKNWGLPLEYVLAEHFDREDLPAQYAKHLLSKLSVMSIKVRDRDVAMEMLKEVYDTRADKGRVGLRVQDVRMALDELERRENGMADGSLGGASGSGGRETRTRGKAVAHSLAPVPAPAKSAEPTETNNAKKRTRDKEAIGEVEEELVDHLGLRVVQKTAEERAREREERVRRREARASMLSSELTTPKPSSTSAGKSSLPANDRNGRGGVGASESRSREYDEEYARQQKKLQQARMERILRAQKPAEEVVDAYFSWQFLEMKKQCPEMFVEESGSENVPMSETQPTADEQSDHPVTTAPANTEARLPGDVAGDSASSPPPLPTESIPPPPPTILGPATETALSIHSPSQPQPPTPLPPPPLLSATTAAAETSGGVEMWTMKAGVTTSCVQEVKMEFDQLEEGGKVLAMGMGMGVGLGLGGQAVDGEGDVVMVE